MGRQNIRGGTFCSAVSEDAPSSIWPVTFPQLLFPESTAHLSQMIQEYLTVCAKHVFLRDLQSVTGFAFSYLFHSVLGDVMTLFTDCTCYHNKLNFISSV